jgi:hypothetical protein
LEVPDAETAHRQTLVGKLNKNYFLYCCFSIIHTYTTFQSEIIKLET